MILLLTGALAWTGFCIVAFVVVARTHHQTGSRVTRLLELAAVVGNALGCASLIVLIIAWFIVGDVHWFVMIGAVLATLVSAVFVALGCDEFWIDGRFSLWSGWESGQREPHIPVDEELRSADEQEDEERAQQPLEDYLEAIALEVGRLGEQCKDAREEQWNEIRAIGRRLYEKGGVRLMRLVCFRLKNLEGGDTLVRTAWHGIGEWLP